MAVSTSSYFSNSIIGVPQLGSDIDVYGTDLTPKFAVGYGFTRADGNKFRYGHFGALTAAGNLVSTDVSESNAATILKAGTTAARLSKPAGELLNANAVGSRYIQLTITATASQFAGGYITIESGTGFGFTYHIKDNDATSATVASDTFLELYDPIVVALDSNSEIAIAGCPYANVEPSTTADSIIAGVAVTNNSASSYGWIQTGGVIGALQDVTIGVVGKVIAVSSNTTGAITVAGTLTGSNLATLGYLVQAGSSAGYSLVYLTLE